MEQVKCQLTVSELSPRAMISPLVHGHEGHLQLKQWVVHVARPRPGEEMTTVVAHPIVVRLELDEFNSLALRNFGMLLLKAWQHITAMAGRDDCPIPGAYPIGSASCDTELRAWLARVFPHRAVVLAERDGVRAAVELRLMRGRRVATICAFSRRIAALAEAALGPQQYVSSRPLKWKTFLQLTGRFR